MLPLKKAQKRLTSLMERRNISLAECAKALHIDESNLSLFMDQESGFSPYSSKILSFNVDLITSQQNTQPYHKLDTESPAESKNNNSFYPNESIQKQAMDLLDEYQAILKLPLTVLSKNLGYSKNALHNIKNLYKKGTLGDKASGKLIDAITVKMNDLPFDVSTTQKNKDASGEPRSKIKDLSIQRLAIQELKRFKVKMGLKWVEVAEALNSTGSREFTGSRLSVYSSPSSLKSISDVYAQDLLDAINHFDDDDWRELLISNQVAANHSTATQQNITPSSKAESATKTSPVKEPEEPTPTSDDMRDILSAHFESQTGYSIREIKEAANEIDLILRAKRAGASVRITTDLSIGSLK